MKISIITLALGIFVSAECLSQTLLPPTNLTMSWAEGTGTSRTVTLNWLDQSTSETAYTVQRKIGGAAWGTPVVINNANVQAYTDTAVPRGSGTPWTYVYYRVRARQGTVDSGAAEVASAGVLTASPTANSSYDNDADGITNADELAAGLNPASWWDATGDLDGDFIPNAWEASPANMLSPNLIVPHVTVDSRLQAAETATLKKTITAAIIALGTTTVVPAPTRIILVRPGFYRETINNTSGFQIAFIVDRNDPSCRGVECVIEGQGNAPVISTTGSAVFDGFVLTRGPGGVGTAFACSESATPVNRASTVRLVNCIIRGMNLGTGSAVVQDGGRLVLSHSTFFMNSVEGNAIHPGTSNHQVPSFWTGSLAHSYSSGFLSGTPPLQSRARVRIMNCVFWNPINTQVPEFFSVGDHFVSHCIVYAQNRPSWVQCSLQNPGLTPKGYLLSGSSFAAAGGAADASPLGILALRDIHGVLRYLPPGRGAHEWQDSDNDQIPDYFDSQPLTLTNAGADPDEDLLTELGEYQAGTDMGAADSQYLTLEQALRLFSQPHAYLTRPEADARYMPLNPTTPRRLLVLPGGGIGMGEFQ